jgi:hypothetical protein
MKSVINKGGLKVFIIQNIDKKIPLDTIAKMKEIQYAGFVTRNGNHSIKWYKVEY